MPDHGVDLAVDLYRMLVVAKDDLPSVSAVYGDVVAKYGLARSGLDGAMARPDHFGGGALGPVHAAWVELHGIAAKFMTDTQANLNDTAAALAKAVEMYATTDRTAADQLHKLIAERGEPTPGR
ncbi:type VII secretion target [Amycolatopsis sp. NPDC051371]|uniref:type VII secretion target n=1 Tax=Amycolatopsis sp. NPDC051371 TaxID=3155800 RepID=UPI00341972E8